MGNSPSVEAWIERRYVMPKIQLQLQIQSCKDCPHHWCPNLCLEEKAKLETQEK